LLVATRRDDTILVFSGSASPTDHATNLQTFEKISHAGIFPGKHGSLHRGFLNAYSRVDHGILYSYTNSSSIFRRKQNEVLLPMFDNCTSTHGEATKRRDDWVGSSVNGTGIDSAATRQFDIVLRRGKKGGCLVKGTCLRHILVLAVQNALLKGRHVHITGHSLGTSGLCVTVAHNSMLISLLLPYPGGGLATLLALDIIINSEHLPVHNLYLWTFGAPPVANREFWYHLGNHTRLQTFLERNSRRFVTVNARCRSDMVASVVPGGDHGPSRPILLSTEMESSILDIHFMMHYQRALSRRGEWSTNLPFKVRSECLGEGTLAHQKDAR
jgi:Lipase (class 3)